MSNGLHDDDERPLAEQLEQGIQRDLRTILNLVASIQQALEWLKLNSEDKE